MSEIRVTVFGLSAVKISDGNTNIYVDAFFNEHTISPFDYTDANIILVTHDHDDHFDAWDTAKAVRETGAIVVGPPSITYPLLVTEGMAGTQLRILYHQDPDTPVETKIGDVLIRSYTSRHFYDCNNMTIHNSYLVEIGKKLIYITGDSKNLPEKEECLNGIDALIYNFVTIDKDLAKVSELDVVAKRFSPRLLLPVHIVDCSWTISPDILRSALESMNIKDVTVLEKSGSYVDF